MRFITARRACGVLVLCLTGCFDTKLGIEATDRPAPATVSTTTAWAPIAEGLRHGSWQGGPEPVSGKLRSGIATYHRWGIEQPGSPRVVRLELRFEAVSGPDASVVLSVGDGAQWVDMAPRHWQLKPGVPSQIAVNLALPDGDSYLHVTTSQQQRSSVKSILLVRPAVVKADVPKPSAFAPAGLVGPNPTVR